MSEVMRAAESRVARATESLEKMRERHAVEIAGAEAALAREESILSLARLEGSGEALAVLLDRDLSEIRRLDDVEANNARVAAVNSGAFLDLEWADANREWFASRMSEPGFARAVGRMREDPETDAKFVAVYPEHVKA